MSREEAVFLYGRASSTASVVVTLLVAFLTDHPWLKPVCLVLFAVLLVALVVEIGYYGGVWGIPWAEVRRSVTVLIHRLVEASFYPDVVIGVGRSGSIVGATLAGNMSHRPFIALDVEHVQSAAGARRVNVLPSSFLTLVPNELNSRKVLVVFAYVERAETMEAAYTYLKSHGVEADKLCYATLFLDPKAPHKSPGFGGCIYYAAVKEISKERWRLTPWSITKDYDYR